MLASLVIATLQGVFYSRVPIVGSPQREVASSKGERENETRHKYVWREKRTKK